MSDAMPTSLLELSWCSRIGAVLYEFRESGTLCDTIIHTKDAQTLSAHANVLAAASPVLKEHIAGNTAMPFDMMLSDISADVVRKLLQFIYCGTLQIDTSNVIEVGEVMEAAGILQLDSITNFCAEHLLKKDDETVCIQTKIEGASTDESVHHSSDVVNPKHSAPDAQFDHQKPQEVLGNISKLKGVDRNVAPNARHAEGHTAMKQSVETPDVKGGKMEAEATESTCKQSDDRMPAKPYSCMQCDRRFCWQRSLRRHERMHTNERPYVCNECGRGFRYTDNLVVHLRTHTGEHPFPCPQCERRFKSRYSLTKHFGSQHPGLDLPTTRTAGTARKTSDVEPPCLCPVCGKTFPRNKNLLRHRRTHLDVKPFTCDTCGKRFVVRANLLTHERIHRGEKPYLCSVCGRAFLDRSSCRRHEKIHSGQRPHTCPTCGKGYIQKYAFTLHQRTHRARTPASSVESNRPEQDAAATDGQTITVIGHVA